MAATVSRLRGLDPRAKLAVLAALAVLGIVALLIVGPIYRGGPYGYRFPDARTIAGIPYFWNVVSNLPFVVVGAIGLASLARSPGPLRPALAVLYLGIFLTGFGSAYHHLAPANERLVFDRLPMTFGFASVFAVALGDRIRASLSTMLLGPLLFVAVATVIYWYTSGHLRPYVFVQGYPMIAIPAMLLLYRGRWLDGRHFMAAVAIYGVAKIVERFDREIYELGHLLSGHSIKHLLAGWATWHLVAMTRVGARASSPD